ncbi:MAG: endonuclease V, partial [Aeoliella sp.]
LEPVDLAVAQMPTTFPYVPGLLTFRECPVLIAAMAKLSTPPDLILVDGQGIAHPRRIGLATHLGLLFGVPTIGCAKKRFIGTYDEPADEAGSYTDLIDNRVDPPELIGAVVRTRSHIKPMFISPGHSMDTPTAIDHVLALSDGYRLPEPTRRAHQCAAGKTLEELRREFERTANH